MRGMRHSGMLGYNWVLDKRTPSQVENWPFSETNLQTRNKGYPTITYQAIVDHTERVLEGTRGFPGAVNNRIFIKSDKMVPTTRDFSPCMGK